MVSRAGNTGAPSLFFCDVLSASCVSSAWCLQVRLLLLNNYELCETAFLRAQNEERVNAFLKVCAVLHIDMIVVYERARILLADANGAVR